MRKSDDEHENLAYLQGDVRLANVLAELEDTKLENDALDDQVSDLQDEIADHKKVVSDLQEKLLVTQGAMEHIANQFAEFKRSVQAAIDDTED